MMSAAVDDAVDGATPAESHPASGPLDHRVEDVPATDARPAEADVARAVGTRLANALEGHIRDASSHETRTVPSRAPTAERIPFCVQASAVASL